MVAKNLKFMFKIISKNFKNAMAIKVDFLLTVIGMFVNNVAFIVIWEAFIYTTGTINGWRGIDIFGLYGFSFTSFGIVRSFFGGIPNMPNLVTTGGLDRFLYTPKNKILKIATSSFQISALGDLISGLVCMTIYLCYTKINTSIILSVILLSITAVIIQFSFSLFSSSFSFHFMDGRNISRMVDELFLLPSTYSGGIIQGALRFIYTFLIPALLVGILSVEFLKNMELSNLLIILLATIGWLILSILFFNYSLKKYESSNFMTFGQTE